MKSEPNFEDVKQEELAHILGKALPYYKQVDDKIKKKWFLESCKGELSVDELSSLKNIHESYFAVGSFVRMVDRGLVLEGQMLESFNNNCAEVFKLASVVKVAKAEPEAKKTKVVDRTEVVFEQLQGWMDELVSNKCKSKFNVSQYIRGQLLSKADLAKVNEFFQSQMNELDELINTSDSQLAEAYSFLTVAQQKKFHEFIASILLATEPKVGSGVRKPRKKKFIAPEKRVSKLNYAVVDEGLELKSINPGKIIGAKVLYVFNTKTLKATIYKSFVGLSVKGSTLLEVDSGTVKTVRKPKVFLKVWNSTEKKMQKLFDELTTKAKPAKARINKDMILIKVF